MTTSGEKALTTDQARRLLDAVDSLMWQAMFEVELWTGIRRGDIVRLQWSNVNWSDNSITFTERKKDDQPHTVYLNESVVNTLTMLEEQTENDRWVFDGRSEVKYGDGHISERTAYNKLQKYADKAGVFDDEWYTFDNIPFHSLRATAAKLMYEAGWNMNKIARQLNDKIETVNKHYLTPNASEMREVAREKPIL